MTQSEEIPSMTWEGQAEGQGEGEEGVDDVERREASLVTSAMSGSAISDRCTVT